MTSMDNTPDSPAKTPEGYTTQGGNFWTLITPEIWKVLHAVLQTHRNELVRVFTTSRGQRVIGMVTPEGPQVAELAFVGDTVWCGPVSYGIECAESRLDAGIKALQGMTQDEIDRLDAGLEACRELSRHFQINA